MPHCRPTRKFTASPANPSSKPSSFDFTGTGHREAEAVRAPETTAPLVGCPGLPRCSLGPPWSSPEQRFHLFEIERSLVSLRHPPGTSIRIQGNANRGDAGADAQPHAHGQLWDTGDAERPDAGVFLLEPLKELLLVHFYRNIGFDAVFLEEDTSQANEAVLGATPAHGLDITLY
jgi:hypothetical protein